MLDPEVSVITPVYNAGAFIAEAIVSVQSQTHGRWEMIIADDGSTDQTVEAASRVAAGDPRVRIESLPHSGLPGVARNRALAFARGEVIAFLDADDTWEPEKLRKQLSALERTGSIWGFCNARIVSSDPMSPSGLFYPSGWRPPVPFISALLNGGSVPFLTFIARRAALERAAEADEAGDVFDEREELKGVEDWDLVLRLAREAEPSYVPESLASYRIHAGGISQAKEENYKGAVAVLRKLSRVGVSSHLVARAERIYSSKRAVSLMLRGGQAWRVELAASCLGGPLRLRELCLASLAVLPRRIAQRLYLWRLRAKRASDI
jgi:glycosyltransferase involved in cell wall biosynthesis